MNDSLLKGKSIAYANLFTDSNKLLDLGTLDLTKRLNVLGSSKVKMSHVSIVK